MSVVTRLFFFANTLRDNVGYVLERWNFTSQSWVEESDVLWSYQVRKGVRMIIISIISSVFKILAPSTYNDVLDWSTSDLDKKINIKDDRTKKTRSLSYKLISRITSKRERSNTRLHYIMRFVMKIKFQAHSKIQSVSDTTRSWRVQYNQRSKELQHSE